MIDQLLELGDIGILKDIPSELTELTTQNNILRQSNSKLKTQNRILWIFLAGLSVWLIYRKFFKPIKGTEDNEIADIKHS